MSKFRLRKIKPRSYQEEASKWALSRRNAVVVLPTGSGKTLIAIIWAINLLNTGEVGKILFLEPTRFLVEQISKYISKVSNVEATPIHGVFERRERKDRWRKSIIAVATPEVVVSDIDIVKAEGFDGVVVDECHHTTGKDAYKKVMQELKFKRKLGLSAFIPYTRRYEIEKYVGEIREWSWSDNRIKPYIPEWIGEVYEAEFNVYEKELYEELTQYAYEFTGKERALLMMAIRWYVRDGILALRESVNKPTYLAELLRPFRNKIFSAKIRPAHKLNSLLRIIRDHEGFNKAIVFIDRVVVAEYVAEKLSHMGTVILCGKTRLREDVREVLRKARSKETRIIVSTSAGEEGIDLPEADLLIVWSNVASTLRFIQRHGRILRALAKEEAKRKLKFVTYIITPDTPDIDSFVDSIEMARKAGVDIPIDPEVVEVLWKRTTRSKIVALLEGRPSPLEWIIEATGMPKNIALRNLRRLLEHGDAVYIYTHLGKVYALSEEIEFLYQEFPEYLTPSSNVEVKAKPIMPSGVLGRSVSGSYWKVYERMVKLLKKYGVIRGVQVSSIVKLKTGVLKLVNLKYSFPIDSEEKLKLVLDNAFSETIANIKP